jgi:hypothetical protein
VASRLALKKDKEEGINWRIVENDRLIAVRVGFEESSGAERVSMFRHALPAKIAPISGKESTVNRHLKSKGDCQ